MMPEITVKLFAALAKTSAENIGGEICTYTLHNGDTINSIIDRANLSNKNIHLAILNGTYVDKTQRDIKLLQDGDVLALWPPIVGG
jgi:molybdopterin converting factor small subunit|tara:strand:- start:10635 stop:10892 length:258 start_codon:yes stop_codon:yes gene_type:complete